MQIIRFFLLGLIGSFLCSFLAAAEPFRIQVKTDNPGTSAANQFTLPLAFGESYNFTIAWGDGASESITTDTSPTHTYASAGTYTISITENTPTGGFPRIYFNYGGDRQKLTKLVQWGDVHWTSFNRAFYGCSNMVITATDEATARTGSVTDFNLAWGWCESLTSFPLINTTAGTDFVEAWASCSSLASFPLINTAAGTDLSYAWADCKSLTSFPLINTAAGISFRGAWKECSGLTSFPLINTASGTDFSYAWEKCSGLTSFPLINTASGTGFYYAWHSCSNLSSFPILDFAKMLTGTACFYGVTLPTATYTAILTDLAARNPNNGVTFHGGNSRYTTSAVTSRNTLTTTKTWTITDGGLAVPIITSPSAANVQSGAAFTYTITASDNPTSFAATNVPIPLLSTGAVIDGTAPTTTGTYTINLSAGNAEGTGTGTLTLYVNAAGAPTITSPATAGGIRGQAITTYQITATNSPTSWDAVGLPLGLTCDTSTGAITGTTNLVGTTSVSLRATNAAGTGVATLTLTISSPAGSSGSGSGGGGGGGCGVGALSALLLALFASLGFRRQASRNDG